MFVLNRQVVLRSIEDDAAGVMSLITNVIIGKMPEDAHNAVLRLAELTRNSAISRFNITSSFDEMIHVVEYAVRARRFAIITWTDGSKDTGDLEKEVYERARLGYYYRIYDIT